MVLIGSVLGISFKHSCSGEYFMVSSSDEEKLFPKIHFDLFITPVFSLKIQFYDNLVFELCFYDI